MPYRWQNGGHSPYGDATPMVEHLEALRAKGDLTMDALEEDARRKDSPLHARLEWDNPTAARKHRRHQIATIIGRVVKVNSRGEARRLYVGVPGDDGPAHYDLVDRVMRKPAFRRRYARRALTEIGALEARFGDLPELAQVMRALRRALRPVLAPAMARMGEP